jgi:uncharacterized membrane protein
MTDRMLVVVFDTEEKAQEGKKALHELESEGDITVLAYAVLAKNADGSATVNPSYDPGPFATLTGTLLGSFIGLIGGPPGVAIGAAVGVAAGSAVDLNNARICDDFIDDVAKELLPNRFAVVAEIEEDLTTPLDARMHAIRGTVFRRALSEVQDTVDHEEVLAMKAAIAQAKAEHARAHAARKTELQKRIIQLESKLQARLEKAIERREATERQVWAKAEGLRTKAAGVKAKAAETHVLEEAKSHDRS